MAYTEHKLHDTGIFTKRMGLKPRASTPGSMSKESQYLSVKGKRGRGKGEGGKGEIIITNYQLPITHYPLPTIALIGW
ncbi:hypothetical protein FDUTEX481_09852 [Tolypothrix sp. PCC 7601]|nr:hypothetical protein FDUTEX481_09852 [Tolypothrix sp. PCC 7601]BAY93616.1 hypothetical protein NIES3275_56570 [Microchaete diplosiphon NIES-3275]